jgi:hypothetical protein
MDVGRVIGWLLLNVGVPLLAPIALLLLLGFTKKYRHRVSELVHGSIAEGQLFWTIIAMCAAASYEAAVYIGQLQAAGNNGGTSTLAWAALIWHVAVIIVSAVLVLFGTMEMVDSDDSEKPPAVPISDGQGRPVSASSRIVTFSIRLACLTALTFTGTHLWVS